LYEFQIGGDTGKDTNSAAAVAATAIQLAQTKKAYGAVVVQNKLPATAGVVAAAAPAVSYLSAQQIIGNTSIGNLDILYVMRNKKEVSRNFI